MTDQPDRPIPVSLRPPAERHAHVALRMKERGGIDWTPEQVAALEKRIKFVRTQLNLQKPVAPILPTLIGEEKEGQVHRYKAMVAGAWHTFAWSQLCRGLISYLGPGEIKPEVVAVAPVSPEALKHT